MNREASSEDWVQIGWQVLAPGERAVQLPADTLTVPLEARVKGILVSPSTAGIGDTVTIRTAAGRLLTGRLLAVNPAYTHGFGTVVPPILRAGLEMREDLERGGRRDG